MVEACKLDVEMQRCLYFQRREHNMDYEELPNPASMASIGGFKHYYGSRKAWSP
jgi:hypothetical protein